MKSWIRSDIRNRWKMRRFARDVDILTVAVQCTVGMCNRNMLRGQNFNMTLYCAMLRKTQPVRPRVPLAPVLSGAALRKARAGVRPCSVLGAGQARLVTSGRIAIALALREM